MSCGSNIPTIGIPYCDIPHPSNTQYYSSASLGNPLIFAGRNWLKFRTRVCEWFYGYVVRRVNGERMERTRTRSKFLSVVLDRELHMVS